MKTHSFDKRFNDGTDISKFLDLKNASRHSLEQKLVNVDLPAWMVTEIDKEANRVGVTRQSLIKMWLADKLENLH
jgi:hypothetical protein